MEVMEPSNPNKKLKLCSSEEDRLRDLPEPVLHHILCFLDLKQAVRTSVLATRWRYLWPSLPILKFDCNLFKSHKAGKAKGFKEFVDHVLLLRDSCSNIQSFCLDCYGLDKYDGISSRIYTWILVALKKNVQEICVHVAVVDGEFQLPRQLFTSKTLEKLELKCAYDSTLAFKLNPLYPMSLPHLKSLLLYQVSIDGNDIPNKIFSSCPVLESLTISFCVFTHQRNLVFTARNLKHLVIEKLYYWGVDKKGYSIKLYAPYLISLRLKDFASNNYSIENLSALVKADIDIQVGQFYTIVAPSNDIDESTKSCREWMVKCLEKLRNVETLTLSDYYLEVVSLAVDVLRTTAAIQFCNLRCLKLGGFLSHYALMAIVYLLARSQNMDSLHFELKQVSRTSTSHLYYPYWDELKDRSRVEAILNAKENWKYMHYHLKFVEIRGVQGRTNELGFLGHLLKHARVLEKMRIFTCKDDSPHRERRLTKFTEKLFTLPRASSSIAIFSI